MNGPCCFFLLNYFSQTHFRGQPAPNKQQKNNLPPKNNNNNNNKNPQQLQKTKNKQKQKNQQPPDLKFCRLLEQHEVIFFQSHQLSEQAWSLADWCHRTHAVTKIICSHSVDHTTPLIPVRQVQFSPVTDWVGGGDMKQDSPEVLFQSFLLFSSGQRLVQFSLCRVGI